MTISRKFAGVLLAIICVATVNAGMTFGFQGITNNDAGNTAIGEAQLFMDVFDNGLNQAVFRFRNTGPLASSICDVYFDDGALLGISSINWSNQPGVEFEKLASPGDLPGGNNINPAFHTTVGFSAQSTPPAQPHGVNPGEWVEIVFDLKYGRTFADVMNALLQPTYQTARSGEHLRVGLHVQGFTNGGSESFVNTIAVPAPDSVALACTAILAGACLLRRVF